MLHLGSRNPVEQPAGEIDAENRAALVACEKAALPLERAACDDIVVPLAGQQTELEWIMVWRRLLVCRTSRWFHPNLESEARPIRVDSECHDLVLVAPDDLPGPRLIIREWLWVPVGHPNVVLQRPTDNCLVEGDTIRAGV